MTRGAGKLVSLLLVLCVGLASGACSSGPAAPTSARTLAPLPTIGPSSPAPTAAPTLTSATPAPTETPASTATEAATSPAETPSLAASAGASAARPGGSGLEASPSETPLDVAPYLTASVSVVNTAQVEVDMEIGIVGETGTVTPVMKVPLQPSDFLTQQVVPATYRIAWTYTGSGAKPTACQLKVGDGEQFGFTVTDHLIAITKDGLRPTKGADLVVATSSLCAA